MKDSLKRKAGEPHCEAADKNDRIIINFRDINHTMHFLYEGRGSQKRVLMVLLKMGTITQQKLTEHLGIQSGSASEVLAKLEKNNLIMRTENTLDRRTTDVMLTEQGRAMAEDALRQRKERHVEMLSYLSEEEKDTLLALLEKLNAGWNARYGCARERHRGMHQEYHKGKEER